VKRARVPGKASEDVENIMGITPELFTYLDRSMRQSERPQTADCS